MRRKVWFFFSGLVRFVLINNFWRRGRKWGGKRWRE